ncbi:hypothetical protein B0J17DRAFT_626485 [Rhizoctonia solani]|nr:hypothetical protein B0J17DRAFT_626485 [Rhizoctonia solani]
MDTNIMTLQTHVFKCSTSLESRGNGMQGVYHNYYRLFALSDARVALDLAATRCLEACKALYPPPSLNTAANETSRLHENKVFESSESFIDSIGRKLSDTMVALKRARNRHAGIHWIPPEILVKIMLLDLEAHDLLGLNNPIQSRALRATSLSSRAQGRLLEIKVVEPPVKEADDSDHDYQPWKSQSVVEDHVGKIGSLNMSVSTMAQIAGVTDWVSRFSIPCCLHGLSLEYTEDRWTGTNPFLPSPATTVEVDSFVNQLRTLRLLAIDCNWTNDKPALKVLELAWVTFSGSRAYTKPILCPSLSTICMFFLYPYAINKILDMIEPIAWNAELDFNIYFLNENHNELKLTDGISALVDMVLDDGDLTSIVSTVQMSPQIKTIQIKRATMWLKDEEKLKRMLKSCSSQRIELISCQIQILGTSDCTPIKCGTPLYEWTLGSTPNVVFLGEYERKLLAVIGNTCDGIS